jgi:RNase P/RNase MRP subunit p29
MCFEHERVVTNDYVVRFECRLFQILKANKVLPRPKDKVVARIELDEGLSILWKGKILLVRKIPNNKKGQSDSDAA